MGRNISQSYSKNKKGFLNVFYHDVWFCFYGAMWFFPEPLKKPDSIICFYAKCVIMLFCLKKQTEKKKTKQQKKPNPSSPKNQQYFFSVWFYFIFPC